jgi:predicted nucleic acid-binding protein
LRRFPEETEVLLAAWDTWCASTLVAIEPSDPIRTMRLAQAHELSFYDASYLWLAEHRSVELVSLDARLVRTARSLGIAAPSPDEGG